MQPPPPAAPPSPGAPFTAAPDAPARRRFLVPAIGAVVAVVLAGGLWLAGGFRQVAQQPEAAAGRPIAQGRFTVVVLDAKITVEKGTFDKTPSRYVAVRMRVVNHDKESVSLGSGGLQSGVVARTRAGKWLKPDEMRGTAAGSESGSIQPGLPVEATALWKMGPADAPKQFTVGFRTWRFGPGFTDDEYRWREDLTTDSLAGRLTLPVAAS